MAWCLTIQAEQNLLNALKEDGDPQKMRDRSPEDRLAFFTKYVGKENALNVAALYEKKLLLKNQIQAAKSFIKRLGGSQETQRDYLSKINSLTTAMSKTDFEGYLGNYYRQQLKVGGMTEDQFQKAGELANKTNEASEKLYKDPNNVQKQLEFGRKQLDLNEYIESLKPHPSPLTVTNVLNLPRSTMFSILHFSAPAVQGWGMVSTKNFWVGAGKMFKYFVSPSAYRDLNAVIIGHPDYQLAREGKLGLTALGDQLSNREEAIQSSLLEHIPGLKIPVLASSRAFTGFLNYVRFSRFIDLVEGARLGGENVGRGSPVVRQLAKVVNDFTGRGALGTNDRFASLGPVLNLPFLSPRGVSATINMFDPRQYLDPKMSPTARNAHWRQLIGMVLATSAILSLVKMLGGKTTTDPTNTDFGKVRFGKTSFGIGSRGVTFLRLLARLITGKSTSSAGNVTDLTSGKYGSQTRADLLITYVRDQLGQVAGAVSDWLWEKDPVGNPFSVSNELYSKLMVLTVQDFTNLYKNDPNNTAAWIGLVGAIFGVSMQTQTFSKTSTKKSSAFSTKKSTKKF